MAEHFHYPPEVFNLLAIRSRYYAGQTRHRSVLSTRRCCAKMTFAEVARIVRTNRDIINKYRIVHNLLAKVNARDTSALRPRRDRRAPQPSSITSMLCWDSDRLKAKRQRSAPATPGYPRRPAGRNALASANRAIPISALYLPCQFVPFPSQPVVDGALPTLTN